MDDSVKVDLMKNEGGITNFSICPTQDDVEQSWAESTTRKNEHRKVS